ncbi:MAG: hypothetical protein CXT72_03245 [Methanobacteriota archaeon]|nr:MAG: hypothetical protein CXT72_03245 [Euryarchaeota archaeon]
MKSFDFVQNLLTTLVIPMLAIVVGIAATPGVWIFLEFHPLVAEQEYWIEILGTGILLGFGVIIWGVTLVLLSGVLGGLTGPRVGEGRYPLRSFVTIQWAFSMLFHRIALFFLPKLVPSFIGTLYYRLSGAKIGKGCQLNTENVNDCKSVIIGNNVVLGGACTINAHLVERDELVMAPVVIGDGALIGAKSIVQPGCKIGEGAVIATMAVLPKWTEVPAGEVWAGIPAKCIRRADGSKPE